MKNSAVGVKVNSCGFDFGWYGNLEEFIAEILGVTIHNPRSYGNVPSEKTYISTLKATFFIGV